MKRTTVFLPEDLDREIDLLARAVGSSRAGLVREALETYVSAKRRKRRPALGFLAAGRSGRTDTAERHEELLFRTDVPAPGQARAGSSARKRSRRGGGAPTRRRP